jgi:hypothetical protein
MLLSSPCPVCGHVWFDTHEYVTMIATQLIADPIKSVIDIGCGNKGIIAQSFWESLPIEKGYACDRHIIKPLPPIWTPLLMDAEGLVEKLGPGGVDFVTHCGLLEHIDYPKAIRVLSVLEEVCSVGMFFTASAMLREVDYKVKQDGNPFHYYKSFWDAKAFEILGYHVDRGRMDTRATFEVETTGWMIKKFHRPDPDRWKKLEDHLANRKCEFCECEPVFWDCHNSDSCVCVQHCMETPGRKSNAIMQRWIDRKGDGMNYPMWRKPRPVFN